MSVPPWKCPTCGHNNPEGSYHCKNPIFCAKTYSSDVSGGRNNFPLIPVGIAIVIVALGGASYWQWQKSSVVKKPISPTESPQTEVPSNNTSTTTPNTTTSSPPAYYKTLASVPNVPEELFYYGGSTTFAPLRNPALVSELTRDHPKYRLTYKHPTLGEPGSGAGINMLIEGQLSFSESSREVKPTEFAAAKVKGFDLKQEAIGYDAIAFYVHPAISEQEIKGLTVEQLKDIFTGKTTNWRDVGGPDLAVIPFSRPPQAGGTVDFIKEHVMNKEDFGSKVQKVENTTWSIQRVSATPGAIGYATASESLQTSIRILPIAREPNQPFVLPVIREVSNQLAVNKAVIANGSYPVTRQLYIVIKQDGGRDQQAGEAYKNLLLSDEGQRLVDRAGFVPLR